MMTEQQWGRALEILEECGLGWWTKATGNSAEFRQYLCSLMEAFAQEYTARCGEAMTSFSVFELYPRRQNQVRAFLQAVASSSSPTMLVMVWRILQGMNIKSVDMRYRMEESFSLDVTLSSPYTGGSDETYQSGDIDSAALVRHLGIMKTNGKPIFDGFYPLHLRRS